MIETVIAGLLAGYGIAMPVGGMSVLIVTLSARTSLKTGLAGAMGTATADGLYALVAALTGAALIHLLQPVARPIQWAAAATLIIIAAKGIIDALRRSRAIASSMPIPNSMGPLRAYLNLLGLTILNPLTIVYFSALVLGSQGDIWSPTHGVIFVLAAFTASTSWQSFLALGGALIGRTLTSEKGRMSTALIGNGVIAALAVQLFFAAR